LLSVVNARVGFDTLDVLMVVFVEARR
jgi:hypothetical protein